MVGIPFITSGCKDEVDNCEYSFFQVWEGDFGCCKKNCLWVKCALIGFEYLWLRIAFDVEYEQNK